MFVFSWPAGLLIKSHDTAWQFMECLNPGNRLDIDVEGEKKAFMRLCRDEDGALSVGFGEHGPSLLPQPYSMLDLDETDFVKFCYKNRASINRYLKG